MIDPKTLSAEERAIVDAIAMNSADTVALWSDAYGYALELSEPAIEARRALFGEPASEGEKVECPNCKAAVEQPWAHYPGGWRCPTLPAQPEAPGLLEAVQRISDSIGWRSTQGDDPTLYYCEFCSEAHPDWRNVPHHDECPVFVIRAAIAKATTPMSNKPAQPEPVAKQDVCAQCSPGRGHNADWSEAFGKQPSKLCGAIGDDGRCALVYDHPGLHSSKPEPAAPVGEMPEAVRLAIYHLRVDAETYRNRMQEECAAANKRTAAALETFWREHAAPPKVAMTEELESLVAIAMQAASEADWFASQNSNASPQRGANIRKAIESVLAQAAGVKP